MAPTPTTHVPHAPQPHPVYTHSGGSLVGRLIEEGLIGLAQASALPGTFRDGRATHPATLTRWIQEGVRLADGRRLRLEAVRINGRWATSRAAVIRFLERQQPEHVEPTPAPRTPTQRGRAAELAAAELRRMGV